MYSAARQDHSLRIYGAFIAKRGPLHCSFSGVRAVEGLEMRERAIVSYPRLFYIKYVSESGGAIGKLIFNLK